MEVSQAHTSAAGATACRAWELGVGDVRRAPRARGERRRHTITHGVDCDLVRGVLGLWALGATCNRNGGQF